MTWSPIQTVEAEIRRLEHTPPTPALPFLLLNTSVFADSPDGRGIWGQKFITVVVVFRTLPS